MPRALDNCVKRLKSQGRAIDSAWAICRASKARRQKRKVKKKGKGDGIL